MCTVTFVPHKRGYRLGMNRDEKLMRITALPPSRTNVNNRSVLFPSEPGGGTWIAVTDSGVCLALINWYSFVSHVERMAVSRGEVVKSLSEATTSDLAEALLEQLPLNRMNPFRLIGIFPATREVIEWRWDLRKLDRRNCRWEMQQWISSGFDEPGAQRVRDKTFQAARRQRTAGSSDWLRRLHRSHLPHTGPFSTCMHRADAATVSYTEVAFVGRRTTMRYHAGPPCKHSKNLLLTLA